MNPTAWSVLVAAFWALVGGGLTWLVTIPLRRRSLQWLLSSLALTCIVSSVAAVWGSVHAMYLPNQELTGSIAVAVVAGFVPVGAAMLAARRLVADNEVLRDAVAEIAAGRVPDAGGRRLTAQLQQLRTEVEDTAWRLAESREREQALESGRRELVAWVSHDLRAPLAGIRAMSEALEDGVAESPELYYKQIHAAVDRLSTMVDDLFEVSRLQSGAPPLDVEPMALDDLVSDCVAALEPLASTHGVRLVGNSDGPAPVLGSVRELNRALTNLLSNAIRHTDSGGLVDVRMRIRQPYAQVSVRDECGGIPPAELGRIFEVGFRGERARTPGASDAGAGLGLAITRGIALAHGGSVEVENVAGGCEFTLSLALDQGRSSGSGTGAGMSE